MEMAIYTPSYADLPAEASAHAPRLGGYVLAIDDDPAIIDLLVSLLRDDEGFTMHTAYSIHQALEQPPQEPPALILLDVSLPGENTEEGVRRLLAQAGWEHVPVLLCSGKEGLDSAARALGAVAYMKKPFNLDAVVSVVGLYARPADA